jgi:hypothetical protein
VGERFLKGGKMNDSSADRIPLLGDYTAIPLTESEFQPVFTQHMPAVFSNGVDFHVREALSERERESIQRLAQRLDGAFSLYLGIFQADSLVGWSFGRQMTRDTYYMINSGLLPEHRNKGVYSALLPRILERLAAEGFRVVTSRHCATNNQVIVPKLKAGFVIAGMEISDAFGVLLHLAYYFNPLRRKAMDFRAGLTRADAELEPLLALRTAP